MDDRILNRASIVVNEIITKYALPKLGFCQCAEMNEAVFEVSTKGCDSYRDMLQQEEKEVLDVVWAQYAAGKSVVRGTGQAEAEEQCRKVYVEQLEVASSLAKEDVLDMLLDHRMEHVKALIAWQHYCDQSAEVSFGEKTRKPGDRAPWMRRW